MELFVPLSMLCIGLVIGGLSLWFISRNKIKHEYDRARSESETERATLVERLAGKDQQLRQLNEAFDREATQTAQLRTENAGSLAKLSALQTRLEEERKAAQEKLGLLDDAQRKLADAFKALSADALRSNNQSFIELAKATLEKFQETAKGDLELRKSAIDELVRPLKESLEKVDGKIGEMEKTRAGAYSELREQVKALATSQLQLQAETGNLVKALRAPRARALGRNPIAARRRTRRHASVLRLRRTGNRRH